MITTPCAQPHAESVSCLYQKVFFVSERNGFITANDVNQYLLFDFQKWKYIPPRSEAVYWTNTVAWLESLKTARPRFDRDLQNLLVNILEHQNCAPDISVARYKLSRLAQLKSGKFRMCANMIVFSHPAGFFAHDASLHMMCQEIFTIFLCWRALPQPTNFPLRVSQKLNLQDLCTSLMYSS